MALPARDTSLTSGSRSSNNPCGSGDGPSAEPPSDRELLSPHGAFTVQVSLSHPERQSSASSSSDEGKANSSNDDSSFSSLGSPSSPPRSPYFPSKFYSTSNTPPAPDALKPCAVVQFDPRMHESPISDLPSSTPRSRDHGMSVDLGIVRSNMTRTSLPLRKKSYSPHLVNQQVACAKGCGKVTVKCVKCAAESKLRMYRSLSLAKPSLHLRPDLANPGIRLLLGPTSPTHQPTHLKGTCSLLPRLAEEQPTITSQNSITLSAAERSWPPYPFRPLGQLDH